MPFTAAQLNQILARSQHPVKYLWVAFSGGMDSHVLLHRLVSFQDELPKISGVIHIHHNLSPDANAWAAHCQKICRQLKIPCEICRIEISAGEGLEDSARRARYEAIARYLGKHDAILVAQHQDDQAETFLLQALRGGGPRGLAGMPFMASLGNGCIVRPLLDISRQQIYEYAQQHHLQWIEDESNQDTRFDRNFIRHNILPKLKQRWPATGRTLSRTATYTAELLQVADELLSGELQNAVGSRPNTLSIQILKKLSMAKASLLIRAMCHQLNLPVPASAHIRELLGKQLHADPGKQIHINWPGAEFRRYQNDLYILSPLPPVSGLHWYHEWDGSGRLVIPELGGNLMLEVCPGQGIARKFLEKGLRIKPRAGSERCQPVGDSYRRDLKSIYQNHRIPPWDRERLPLIYAENTLIAVADIIVCQHASVAQNEAGYQVLWQKNETL